MPGVVALALVAGVVGPARAQSLPRVELAGGYQLLKLQSEQLDAAGVGTFLPIGWFFEAAVPVSSGLTLVAQLGGHYPFPSTPATLTDVPGTDGDRLKVHTFLAGPRVVGRRADGPTAFFHLLAGGTRVGLTRSATAPLPGMPVPWLGADGTTTELTLQAGGGFDFPLPARWSGRVTADYLRLFARRTPPTRGARVGVGWVVRWAR